MRRLRTLPTALWACIAIATLHAAAWAVITPTFQVPDEPVHVGYAQWIGETGTVPQPVPPGYYQPSPDADLAFQRIPFTILGDPSWSEREDRVLDRELTSDTPRRAESGAGYAVNNPPLYYALAAIPYRLAYGGDFFDRVLAMRLLSALLLGATVGFTFLFLRELMPRTRWAWTVGALAVALQPVAGFVGGGVNTDMLVWPLSAALFWMLARSFRHGLTARRGAAIGGLLAAGLLTKGSFFGIVPGALLGLLLLVLRDRREAGWRAPLRAAAVALVALAVPTIVWLLVSRYGFDRGGETVTSGFNEAPAASVREQLSYLWQFWLPRMPWQNEIFPGPYPAWVNYFQGFVGRFGWNQSQFAPWVQYLVLGVMIAVGVLAAAGLVRARRVLRGRWQELLTYAALAGGLAVLVNVAGYRYSLNNPQGFEQIRYLFPLLPLYGAVVAVAAKGAGRRLGPAVAGLMVALAAGHALFGQLFVLMRYYS